MKRIDDSLATRRTRGLAMAIGGLCIVAAVGASLGFLLPPAVELESPLATAGLTTANVESPVEPSVAIERFALSAADAADPIEAATLAIDRGGRVYLAWASQTGERERALFLTTSSDGGQTFAPPREMMRSPIFTAVSQVAGRTFSRALRTVPHLAASGDAVHLAWTESHLDNSTVHMVVATSTDGGQSFSEPRQIHRSDAARPTFTWLSSDADGTLAASWLDNRNGVQQPFVAVRTKAAAAFDEERIAFAGRQDRGICPCCPTSTAIDDRGAVYVAFRNLMDGYRDIWVVRLAHDAAEVEPPRPVAAPRWKFDGCPHDGPSLAVSGETLHVVWMDAHSGRERVYYARGMWCCGGFETIELNAGSAGTQGNAKVHLDARGALHVVWEESMAEASTPLTVPHAREHGGAPAGGENLASPDSAAAQAAGAHRHGPPTGAGRAIWYAQSPKADGRFTAPIAIAPRPNAFQTRPDLACAPDGKTYVTWNELDEQGKHVVIVRLTHGENGAATQVLASAP